MTRLLEGQRIVVFGAAGTLGSAFVAAAREHGASCLAVDLRKVELGVPYRRADVTSAADLAALVHELERAGDRIDVAINFAGIHQRTMELGVDDPENLVMAWRSVIETNLTGAFLITAALAQLFVRQRHGHIIHLCSNGSRLALYGSHAYVASKHGVEGVIRSAAAQLARHGVRVNGLAPGTVETDLNRHLLRDDSGRPSLRAAAILAHTPTKRFCSIAGVMESAIALCVPQRHLTGNVVFCDDGYNVEGHSWPEGTRAVYEALVGAPPAGDDPAKEP
jgi:NAD(P)-dependent dehydrogenase (short-subunit alcohol dehydrogenase family)